MSAALVCAGLGAAALGYNAFLSRKSSDPPSACASARVASRVEEEEEDANAVSATHTDDEDSGYLTAHGEKQFESHVRTNVNSNKVRNAKKQVMTQYIETKANKGIGIKIPRMGCSGDSARPKPKGGMWFNQPEQYLRDVAATAETGLMGGLY